jgi:hypothetical protein
MRIRRLLVVGMECSASWDSVVTDTCSVPSLLTFRVLCN